MDLEPITLLIVDDHAPFRRGLRAMLRGTPDMVVLGEAGDGDEAEVLAERLQPDVVLMDLQMPGTGGLTAIRRILAVSPHIRVLVLTMSDDDESVFRAVQAGARGYVLKGALKADLLRSIRAVHRGEAIFGPAIAQRLIQFFTARPFEQGRIGTLPMFPDLTEREREILSLIAQHRSNPEIATQLSLSQKTVRNHASNIFSKLQVVDRAEAIIRAREAGLG